ncbi:MAG: ACP S-malonyltransferase [Acidiferrobacterales bacterium]
MGRETAVIVCPGRGTYNKAELGYLRRYHADKTVFMEQIDRYRRQFEQPAIAELDAMSRYSMDVHNIGENASALIYACALCDITDIDSERFDIVAVTGNSMGWYLALATAKVLDEAGAIQVVNTMGSMMKDEIIGAQIVYPVVDSEWRIDPDATATVRRVLSEVNQNGQGRAYLSINLGGAYVLGADEWGAKSLMKQLPPKDDRYPLQLPNHAAFHTPLLDEVARKAQRVLSKSIFQVPHIPLIDGRGHIWQPYSTDLDGLYAYTLDYQVRVTYDFSKAVEVAIKEFAPDRIIVPGPGYTLGAPIAQELIKHQWLGIRSKDDFLSIQNENPFVLCMGIEEQRQRVVERD